MRIVQKKNPASGRTEEQKENNAKAIQQAHQELLHLSQQFLNKSGNTLAKLNSVSLGTADLALIEGVQHFIGHAERQIRQISHRVLDGEVIPHEEKVFSLFEPHTEWVSKGKAGVPVEFGLRVCVLEDQYQFILHHRVMEQATDAEVAVPMVVDKKAKFPTMVSCSFDKGFHSKENQEELAKCLEVVGLKHKGKLSKIAKEIESSKSFKEAQHKHAAVESGINALEVHGLNKCKDPGIGGFKRCVALGIVTRNIHRIGDIVFRQEQKKLARQKNCCRDGTTLPLAA